MKSSLIFLSFLAFSWALPSLKQQDLCADCLETTEIIGDFLVSDTELEFQMLQFSSFICSDPETQATCTDDIYLFWPGMARALFSNENTVPVICGDIGICPPARLINILTKKPKVITCSLCEEGVKKLAQVVESEKNIYRVIDALVGDAYCTEPSSGLGDPCIKFVESFVPEAMPLAATLIRGDIDRLCNDAVHCV